MDDTEETKRRADRATLALSLTELRLVRIDAELLLASPKLDITSRLDVQWSTRRLKDFVIYDVTYQVMAEDAAGIETVKGVITFSMVFKVLNDILDDEDLSAFGLLGVLSIAHPYAREIFHNLTTRMGLPPLLLEVMPPTLETMLEPKKPD
jgi:preprotein translocase subunit SecB